MSTSNQSLDLCWQSAIHFLEEAGLTAIINDDIVSKMIFVGSLIGGTCIGGFVGTMGHSNGDFNHDEALVLARAAWIE